MLKIGHVKDWALGIKDCMLKTLKIGYVKDWAPIKSEVKASTSKYR